MKTLDLPTSRIDRDLLTLAVFCEQRRSSKGRAQDKVSHNLLCGCCALLLAAGELQADRGGGMGYLTADARPLKVARRHGQA
eukprot:767761-Hanusia_phi.AAC.3